MYFLYTNLYADDEVAADFVIRVNGVTVCEGSSDMNASPGENGTPSCGAVAVLTEGTKQENMMLHETTSLIGCICIILWKLLE